MLLEGSSMSPFALVLVLSSGEVLKRLGCLSSSNICLLGLSSATYPVSSHSQSSLIPLFLCSCGLFCLEEVLPPPLDNSYSSFQAHVKCHFLQEAFLDAHHLGHTTLLCDSQLCSTIV